MAGLAKVRAWVEAEVWPAARVGIAISVAVWFRRFVNRMVGDPLHEADTPLVRRILGASTNEDSPENY